MPKQGMTRAFRAHQRLEAYAEERMQLDVPGASDEPAPEKPFAEAVKAAGGRLVKVSQSKNGAHLLFKKSKPVATRRPEWVYDHDLAILEDQLRLLPDVA